MDVNTLVRQAVSPTEATSDDRRRTWDLVWRAILQQVLAGEAAPSGTAPELVPAVRELLQERRLRTQTLADLCPAFYNTNRGPSLAFSELWCKAEYTAGETEWFHTSTRGQQLHAERQALQRLQRKRRQTTHVTLYLNLSPCCDCADAIMAYCDARPRVVVSVRFTSLFAHHASNHCRGLQRMAERGIQVAVFDDQDWDILAAVVRKDRDDVACSSEENASRKSRAREDMDDYAVASLRKRLKTQE